MSPAYPIRGKPVFLSLIVGIGMMMPEDIQRLFGKRVRQRRLQLGLTQQNLADRTGLHRSYIGEIELGRRNVSLKNIARIADALEVDVTFLL